MPPVVKYSLGRLGLFVGLALVMWPVPVNFLIKLMVALLGSMALQFVVLRKWRIEMIDQVDGAVVRHREQRDELRAALAGEDDPDGTGELHRDSATQPG